MNNDVLITEELLIKIKEIIVNGRKKVFKAIHNESLLTYWNIGKIIIEHEQSGKLRAEYGKSVLLAVSKRLSNDMGKGFSRSNLQNMRMFYINFPNCQTLSGELTWSHYCELVSISDSGKRSFYEKESINSNWTVRELKRQIESSLFERLILSDGKVNKEKVLKLAKDGNIIATAQDILKDPYVFEFLGMPEYKPFMEKDLERKLIRQIEDFLLELGKGFMFVGSQQRVTINNTHYYVDMVFYNKILKSYVLIDLKTGKLKPEHVGQINAYLNYYRVEINESDDNDPIGIILCTDKDEIVAEYALGGMSSQIFASKYVLYIPNKEELIKQVEIVLEEGRNDEKTSQI